MNIIGKLQTVDWISDISIISLLDFLLYVIVVCSVFMQENVLKFRRYMLKYLGMKCQIVATNTG